MSRRNRTIEQLEARLVQARRGGNKRLCERLREKIRNKHPDAGGGFGGCSLVCKPPRESREGAAAA